MEIRDSTALHDWLNGQPVEFACVLAARIALRAVPVLELALHEDEADRRGKIILPSFRALAASSYAGAWPSRAGYAHKVARAAGQEAGSSISDFTDGAQMDVLDARQAVSDMPEEIGRLESDVLALNVAARAVNVAVEAAQSVVAIVDAAGGISSSAAVFEAAVSAAEFAQYAIEGIHGDTACFDDPEEEEPEMEIPPHVEEFWNAVVLDSGWLESSDNAEISPEKTVMGLSEEALWLGGTPVWASKRWADFKDRLPDAEGWQVWIGWYETRIAGRQLDADLETDLLKIPDEEWRQGPGHVNARIAKLFESRTDPLLGALARSFEDLEAVRQVSSINLAQYSDRIRNALPSDPHQVIGATKEMLEATMKTILDDRGKRVTNNIGFSDLTNSCLTELGLIGCSQPANEVEKYSRKIASSAKRMIGAANELRNHAGTGHGYVVGKEPVVTAADAELVASAGLILAAWLLRHNSEGQSHQE